MVSGNDEFVSSRSATSHVMHEREPRARWLLLHHAMLRDSAVWIERVS